MIGAVEWVILVVRWEIRIQEGCNNNAKRVPQGSRVYVQFWSTSRGVPWRVLVCGFYLKYRWVQLNRFKEHREKLPVNSLARVYSYTWKSWKGKKLLSTWNPITLPVHPIYSSELTAKATGESSSCVLPPLPSRPPPVSVSLSPSRPILTSTTEYDSQEQNSSS